METECESNDHGANNDDEELRRALEELIRKTIEMEKKIEKILNKRDESHN